MAEPSEQLRHPALKTDNLKPFVNYRNPQDDKVHLAIQEAARQLRAEGKASGEGLAALLGNGTGGCGSNGTSQAATG